MPTTKKKTTKKVPVLKTKKSDDRVKQLKKKGYEVKKIKLSNGSELVLKKKKCKSK